MRQFISSDEEYPNSPLSSAIITSVPEIEKASSSESDFGDDQEIKIDKVRALRVANAKRFYLSENNKISIEIGLILHYNEEEDELESVIGGNFYFYNMIFPLRGVAEFRDLFSDFSRKNMRGKIFALVHSFDDAVRNMNAHREAFDSYILDLEINTKEILSDIADLKMICRNRNLTINQIFRKSGVSAIAYEIAINMSEFFEHFCSKN